MRTVEKDEALRLVAESRRQLLGDSDSQGCVMCALSARASHPDSIAETDDGVVLLDRFATSHGGLLIISRQHFEETADLPWQTYSALQRLAYDATRAQRRALRPARVYQAILGSHAQLPMSFPHFHIHLLPVYAMDERARPASVFSWSAGVTIYEDAEAQALAAQIRAAWPERK